MINIQNKLKMFFGSDAGESFAAFLTGGIPASVVSFHFMEEMVFPIMLAGLTGLVGGAFALLGKDIYKWCKKKILKDVS